MTDANFGGVVREVLDAETGNVRFSGVVREVLDAETGTVRFAGLRRELLLVDAPAPEMRKPWINLRLAAFPDDFDGDPQEQWHPPHTRYVFQNRFQRPYLMINT